MLRDMQANMLGAMIEKRARNEAMLQAECEVGAFEASITNQLDAIGVNAIHLPSVYQLIADVRQARIDGLVRARLQALAERLMAEPVERGVILTSESALTKEQVDGITAYAKRNLPTGSTVMVVSGDIKLGGILTTQA